MAEQAEQLRRAAAGLDENFVEAVRLLTACRGRAVAVGIGKSGIAARKVAATLACTGFPAFYLHPGDGAHGDLGAVTSDDIVIAISVSGSTREVVWLLPHFAQLGVPVVAITANPESPLGRAAEVVLQAHVQDNTPAPTASTLVTQALGDALAVAVMEARELSADDVAPLHPGSPGSQRIRATSETRLVPAE